jgi:succinoglycan biosynthesis transport protein ExoP
MRSSEGNRTPSQYGSDSVPLTVTTEHTSDMSIADLFRILAKRKWLIVLCTFISLILATTYVELKTPIYESVASIRIDPGRVGSLGLSDLVSLTGDSDQITTEIEIVKSDGVVLATLAALPPKYQEAFAGRPVNPEDLIHPERMSATDRDRILSRFKSSLDCKRYESTQIVQIKFRDANPELATAVANQIVESYTRNNFQSRYSSVAQVSIWLSDQMNTLKERAAQAQKKLSDYQEQNDILGADVADNTITDKLKTLNSELTQAEAERIAKEAQYRVAASGNPQLLQSLAPDPTLQALESQEAQLFATYAQLSSKFGPGYQPLRDLKDQRAKVAAQIDQEVKMVTGRLQQEYQASLSTESMLRAQYQNQTEVAYGLNRKVAEYALLRDEGESSRDLYDMLQYKLQQAGVDAGLGSINTTIVSRAQTPSRPAEPKKLLTIAIGFCLGLATGIGAAFMKETIDNNIQSVEQIESILNLPTLSVVPLFTQQDTEDRFSPEGTAERAKNIVTLKNPLSHASESYRNLRNSILLSSLDHPLKTLLFTSSLPGEGKSTSAINYAVVLAQKGVRVLLIDADLRRPSLARILHTTNLIGLSSWVLDETSMEPLTPINEIPTLRFIPSGPKISSPSEVLGSIRFQNLIRQWETEYDYIILDSAPVLSVSDSVSIASWADAVLVVARYGVTPVDALKRTKNVLSRANARIHGIILNGAADSSEDYYYGKNAGGYYE